VEAKCIEDAHVGHAMAMAQPGKAAPSALFGQHRREQIERMHGCQQRQQVDAPELGRAQLPARAAHRASAPMLVDEVVGNVRIQDVEQSARAGHRKAVHAAKGYPFGNDAPGFCWNSQFFNPSGARTVTYAETCNTLLKLWQIISMLLLRAGEKVAKPDEVNKLSHANKTRVPPADSISTAD